MRKHFPKATLICTLLLAVCLLPAQAQTWHTDWDEAAKESRQKSRPILINFTGSDWCGWCIKLKDEVFITPTFKEWAAKSVVLLEIDFPRRTQLSAKQKAHNDQLAQKYGIRGFPTIVFADSKGGVLGQYGYDAGGPANWIKNAETHMK